jgi:MarR-like DNA-binding transcriptional regulator SgrR of sgrS sRNA
MKPIGFLSIAVANLLIAATATAATRPHYGGILHIQIETAIVSLDPADANQDEVPTRNVLGLVFDTLVSLDDRGEPQPALATHWSSELGNQRWQLVLRPGVIFSDGVPMTPEIVAEALRRSNPDWKISTNETEVIIQLDAASPDLPAELALRRNAIAKVGAGKIVGTGPFVVSEWDPRKKLLLTARDDYWGGRTFLDGIEVQVGKSFRERMIAFDLGQAQLVEVPGEQAHLYATQARELRISQPVELLALVFADAARSPEDLKERQALALSIDRTQLNRVVLQGGGEPAGGLLPDWLTGYGFLFPQVADLPHAQQLRAGVPQSSLWSLGFDPRDALARLLAERVVLNAGDAGLRLQLDNANTAELRLVRIPLPSLDGHVALTQIAKSLKLAPPKFLGNTVDDLYHAENAMLQTRRVIPLLHLPTAWAVSKTVKDWKTTPDGSWPLADVWLAPAKP